MNNQLCEIPNLDIFCLAPVENDIQRRVSGRKPNATVRNVSKIPIVYRYYPLYTHNILTYQYGYQKDC